MVSRRRIGYVVPQHCPDLRAADYLPYLASWLRRRGDSTRALQDVWSPWLGRCRVVPMPTGRQALWEFLEVAGLRPGDEVLVAAYNFYVIVRILMQRGLVPVFVDIEPHTLCMDPRDLAAKVTPRSRLVVATHMFGHPADMGRIRAICDAHHLLLFEDCAHAVGTQCGTRQVGTFGDGALFSFGIYKMITAFGGGMLVLRDPSPLASSRLQSPRAAKGLAAFLDHFIRCVVSLLLTPRLHTLILYPLMTVARRRAPRLYHLVYPSGDDPTYVFRAGERAPFRPYMARMIARQLGRLKRQIARRRAIVHAFKEGLAGVGAIRLLREDEHGRSNGGYFGVLVPDPEGVARHLEDWGILSNPHEYYNCAELRQFAQFGPPCPQAASTARHLLRLPNFPALRDHDVAAIIEAIRAYFADRHPPSAPAGSPAAGGVAVPADAPRERATAVTG